MKVLVVGAAGYVGSIIVPALEKRHDCRYLDLRPVPRRKAKSFVGDINDDKLVRRAVKGMEGVIFMAMGLGKPTYPNQPLPIYNELDPCFNVNVRAMYRVLSTCLAGGTRLFVYASTMSTYKDYEKIPRIDENRPTTSWEPYGITKRLGEYLCHAAHQEYPKATVLALRMVLPRTDADWAGNEYDPRKKWNACDLGPEDCRRLFLAALTCRKPGAHFLVTTGDLEQKRFDHTKAKKLIGWLPIGR